MRTQFRKACWIIIMVLFGLLLIVCNACNKDNSGSQYQSKLYQDVIKAHDSIVKVPLTFSGDVIITLRFCPERKGYDTIFRIGNYKPNTIYGSTMIIGDSSMFEDFFNTVDMADTAVYKIKPGKWSSYKIQEIKYFTK